MTKEKRKMNKDREILRELGGRVAEIASLPVLDEKRRLWRALNGLKPERPMVTIDQVCWNEMNIDGKLSLLCENTECRAYEETLRRVLLQWEYFPVDMVVEPFIKVRKAINNSAFGMSVQEHTLAAFEGNDVMRELNYIDPNDFYDKVREMDWFKDIMNKYRPYAKNSKSNR